MLILILTAVLVSGKEIQEQDNGSMTRNKANISMFARMEVRRRKSGKIEWSSEEKDVERSDIMKGLK